MVKAYLYLIDRKDTWSVEGRSEVERLENQLLHAKNKWFIHKDRKGRELWINCESIAAIKIIKEDEE